ncbi:MAG TPA: hypothetical protein VG497_27610, partial [Kribbella sp.]|nr:hypothetical protein [Kribbella sp.]
MSDNRNQPPAGDPADPQPDRPQEPRAGWFGSRDNEAGPRAPGDGQPGAAEGQSASWWTGDTEAKREFQNPAQSDAPANNWFDGGWDPTRREHPDQPAGPNQ